MEQTAAMYCSQRICSLRATRSGHRPAGLLRRLSNAQVLTIASAVARYFGGNSVPGQQYMKQHWGLIRLADSLVGLFATFGTRLKEQHTGLPYVADSSALTVCHNTSIARCKPFQD